MYARTSAIALALLPYPTPVILASLAYSNFFIPSGDQDSDSFYNALLNKTLPKDPYDEWSDFARVSRLLEALLAARLLEQVNLVTLKLEYVSKLLWFDSAFPALSDVGLK